MKVKLLTSICCPYGNFGEGAVAELPEKIAKGLIAGEHAVEIVEKKVADTDKVNPEQKAKQLAAKKTTRKPAAKKVTAKK